MWGKSLKAGSGSPYMRMYIPLIQLEVTPRRCRGTHRGLTPASAGAGSVRRSQKVFPSPWKGEDQGGGGA